MPNEQIVWGVHIKNVPGEWPIEKECIAIGWHELGDVGKIAPSRQAFKDAYAQAIPIFKAGNHSSFGRPNFSFRA